MYRLAELVHAAGTLDLVAGGEEGGEVPGQAGGFAGDVDDVFYAVCKDLWKSLGVDAVAWGIQDDHVRLLGKVIQRLQYISGDETAIGQAVKGSVYFGCFYSFLHNLHADHFFCYRSKKLGDGSGAAVKVKHFLILGIPNVIPHNGIQYFCCQRVRLEEGKGADLKAQAQKCLIKIILSIKNLRLIALHHIRQGIVDDVHDPHDFALKRKGEQSGNQRRIVVLGLACGNHVNQNLSGGYPSSKKQMAQISGVLHFLIMYSSKLCEKVQHAGKNGSHVRMHQLTIGCSQHIIGASFLVKSQRQGTVLKLIPKREFHLIPVSKLNGTSMDSLPVKIHVLPNCCLKKTLHLIFFHLQLLFVRHGLIHTASAGRENATDRFPHLKR